MLILDWKAPVSNRFQRRFTTTSLRVEVMPDVKSLHEFRVSDWTELERTLPAVR